MPYYGFDLNGKCRQMHDVKQECFKVRHQTTTGRPLLTQTPVFVLASAFKKGKIVITVRRRPKNIQTSEGMATDALLLAASLTWFNMCTLHSHLIWKERKLLLHYG